MYAVTSDRENLKRAEALQKIVLDISCVDTEDELGWGRNFKYMTAEETHVTSKPLTFLNSKIGFSFLKLFSVLQDKNLLVCVKKAIYSILKNGKVCIRGQDFFIGYSSDINTKYAYNASIYAARLFLFYLQYSGKVDEIVLKTSLKKLSYEIVKTVIRNQDPDGSWVYGFTHSFDKTLVQIDFHQGFVIDTLLDIHDLIDDRILKDNILHAFNKGIDFMVKTQITNQGIFKWRYPRKYPIDIHNQAQGIISLSKSLAINDRHVKKLHTILEYTLSTFWNKEGNYFYYQKNPFWLNKIPYIRWAQAWMLYALSEYLRHISNNHDKP